MAAMTASLSTRWDLPAFDLPPTAPGTGPFTSREFLETWWRHRAEPGDELLLMASEQALLPLLRRGELVAFLGEQDLTDYHSPRGADLAEVVASLVGVADPGWRFDLNSVPEPAATRLAESFESAGVAATGSHERYLEDLGKKQRHEVRRKRRRFADELGEPRLLRAVGDDAVAAFAAMHRLAAGDKGAFMTAGMEAFFVALHHDAGGVVDVLCGDDGVPVAAGFGFEDPDGYYLYNSAFDPAAGPASPGLVLVSLLLERAIADGKTVFDFLKGDEEYKFRLGATARPLFRVTGRFGAAG
jgi:CelD/BcsL family acetyltransferase involved in cellulose biosynthesis